MRVVDDAIAVFLARVQAMRSVGCASWGDIQLGPPPPDDAPRPGEPEKTPEQLRAETLGLPESMWSDS